MNAPRKWRKAGEERRRTPRTQRSMYAALDAPGDPLCVVVDVSRAGIGLRTTVPPGKGDTVTMRLGVGEEIRTLRGTVRRVTRRVAGGYALGIEWLDVSDADLAFLDQVESFLDHTGRR